MELNELRDFLGDDWTQTQACIREALSSDIALLVSTNDSMLENAGKQLRPILSLLIARACSAGRPLGHDSWHYAAASELLHNATLLHDDVADSSPERRGKPTVYSQMGPEVSVLLGDFWLVKAVDCVLSCDRSSGEVIRVFARTLSNLAEGEMFQLQKACTGDTCEEDYFRIIYNKTATLFEASARSAVMGVDGEQAVLEHMAEFGRKLGLAFQIRDDIFDYCLDMNVGKPVGADILERKITLPLLGALASVPAERQEQIRRMVTEIGEKPEARDEIVAFVRENGGLEYAQQMLTGLIKEAVGELDILPESAEKAYLCRLADFVGSRII